MDDTYLYIGNLPYDATEEMIRDAFAGAITMQEIRLALAPDTGLFMGYAFAKLSSKDEVEKEVKELNGKEIGTSAPRACFLDRGLNQVDLWARVD